MQIRSLAALLLTTAVIGGCAAKNAGTMAQATPAGAQIKRSSNVITGAELSETTAQNLYQAVQMLRPNWFRQRSTTTMGGTARTGGSNDVLVVYVDNTRYGDVNSLQQLTSAGVTEMRYLDPSEATVRYGTGHSKGAILIRMTRKP